MNYITNGSMRVLQVGKFYPIRGGVEKVMWDLTRGLSGQGVDCDMLCACAAGDMPKGGEVRFNGHGRVVCLRAFAKVAATMLCPSMISWLRRHAAQYDIVHIHHPDPMACLALWLSGYRGRVVLHWHSDILKQKALLKLYRPLQSWLIRRADLILGTTPVYVAGSPFLKDVQGKVSYVPIGIDPVPLVQGLLEDDGQVTVFSLGRLVEYKGYEYLVDAARYLPENYRIVIAGDGPLRDELRARIDGAGLSGRVLMPGRISDEEKAEWFRKCDVFCLSSIMKTEAFAIVQIEAMSCGKPVVATSIPGSGVSWVNEHGVSGLNVPVADPEALAKAIVDITSDAGTYGRYSSNALRRYEACFTLSAMVSGCMEKYEMILSN